MSKRFAPVLVALLLTIGLAAPISADPLHTAADLWEQAVDWFNSLINDEEEPNDDLPSAMPGPDPIG